MAGRVGTRDDLLRKGKSMLHKAIILAAGRSQASSITGLGGQDCNAGEGEQSAIGVIE